MPLFDKAYRFSKIFQFFIIAILFLAVGLLGFFWISSEYRHHLTVMQLIHDDYVAARKAEVKTIINQLVDNVEFYKKGVEDQLKGGVSSYVHQATVIAQAIYDDQKETLSESEVKELIINTLMPIRFFDGRGYYWIHDTDYTLVAHPFRPKSVGSNDKGLTDSKGQKITQSFVRTALADPNGGFVTYYWNKPGIDEQYHRERGMKKIAYLKLFTPYNWVIGVGEYVDDVEKEAQAQAVKRVAAVRFGAKGYVFSHSREGICLNHIKQENIGKNRWELEDAAGMKVVQELDRTGRKPGGGFLEYVASIDPQTGEPAPKISFVQSVEDWGWVLGSGVYIDDIKEKIDEYRSELLVELRWRIISTIVILLLILAVVFFIGRHLIMRLLGELNLFAVDSGTGSQLIDVDRFRIRELREIARRANTVVMEKELAQAELHKAKRMESIGLMAGGVAHDLNNILSGIVSYPELILLSLPQDSKLREPIVKIQESGERAAAVVADLLTVARGIASTRETVDLQALVAEYLGSPQHENLMSSHPAVAFQVQYGAVPLLISCSPVHVTKCVMNLMRNAAEAIEGRGTVAVTTFLNRIEGNDGQQLPAGDYAVVQVADSGSGIDQATLQHVFEPFYTKKVMGRSGTGLGLTVVWNTMVDHQGMVTAESDSSGSCFRLFFPLATTEEEKEPAAKDLNKLKGSGAILVVDDEALQRDVATRMLSLLGYRASAVSSGEEALAFLRETEVDLVLLDMIMDPGMDGCETYRRILTIRPNQRAVIASGFSESEAVREAVGLGAGGLISKPYTLYELGAVVQKVLDRTTRQPLAPAV